MPLTTVGSGYVKKVGKEQIMPKIDITKTELVWPGKYNEDGTLKEVPRVNLPFQIIETVNESQATREAKKGGVQRSFFDVYEGNEGETFEEGWKNKLIWGDNLLIMSSLLERFSGKIDLIYIDPPFATGADFSFMTTIGEPGEKVFKEQSILEEKAYRDTWGKGVDSFITMIYERLVLMKDLLTDTGSIYVHCDWRVTQFIRSVLDNIFGSDRFINEVIWSYKSGGATENRYGRKHDSIHFFSKSDSYIFNTIKEKSYNRNFKPYRFKGVKEYKDEVGWYTLVNARDVWEMDMVGRTSSERIDYPTQKPEILLERILQVSSNKNSLVADFFCGSGTTLAVAEKLGRRWIGCDLGRWSINVTRKRLLGIENCRPFDLLNLGKYERQYWQGVTFGEKKSKPMNEQALFEYLSFMLKLYGAQPVAGIIHLHGKKRKAMIHIGAVDAPVTISEVHSAVEECINLKQKELHVLGWEWEMGLQNLVVKEARNRGIKLLLLQIPREVMEQQATDKGDIRFFELAYLDAAVRKPKKLTAQVTLKDFVIPNAELIPGDVRSKIGKWSDYIDYWAVDWDFRNDTFMQGWVTYRTRKDRSLLLTSDPHTYEKPGKYRILVKAIDIFGNDTSQVFEVEVK